MNKLNILSIDTDYVQSPVCFENLIKFYLNYIDDVDIKNILFSQAHANIFYILDPLLKQKETIDLVSIYHHHDIWYYNNQLPINSFKSSNWLGYYLKKKNFIDNIFWLANYDSFREGHDDMLHITYDIEDIKFKKFDYIFVCNSPCYSNLLSESAYNTLVSITTHVKNCKKFDFFKPNILNHITQEIFINEKQD